MDIKKIQEIPNTESIGIYTEKVICEIFGITYKNKRIYNEIKNDIRKDIVKLIDVYIKKYKNIKKIKVEHCGNMNKYYDFLINNNFCISVKTIINNNKVCPQNIGQTTFKKFNSFINENFKDKNGIKKYIIKNNNKLIDLYLCNLLICDITFIINYKNGLISIIEKNYIIKKNEYKMTKTIENWNESNSVYIIKNNKKLNIGEYQIHNNRNCIKFRFNIKNIDNIINVNKFNLNCNKKIYKLKMTFPSFNYIGSKLKLLTFLKESIESYTDKKYEEIESFADICAGTGIVSYDILKNGCIKILTNDIQNYAYILSSILTTKDINKEKIIEIIDIINESINNELNEQRDNFNYFIYNNYTEKSKRKYFTEENGLKIDIVRNIIEKMYKEENINNTEYKLLIKILLYASTKISNISCVFGAFLKKYKKSALQNLKLDKKLINILIDNENIEHKAYNHNISDLLDINNLQEYEICYIDPPYVSRQYCDNYHVLETISKYDNPILKNCITGLREESSKSKLCYKTTAASEFKEILKKIKSKYVFISYSTDGILSKNEWKDILIENNWKNIIIYEHEYSKFSTKKETSNKNVKELLICGTNNVLLAN